MGTNLPAKPLHDLLADVKLGRRFTIRILQITTVFGVAKAVQYIAAIPLQLLLHWNSLTCVSDVNLQSLILEVVSRKDFDVTTICVFKCVFQKVD